MIRLTSDWPLVRRSDANEVDAPEEKQDHTVPEMKRCKSDDNHGHIARQTAGCERCNALPHAHQSA